MVRDGRSDDPRWTWVWTGTAAVFAHALLLVAPVHVTPFVLTSPPTLQLLLTPPPPPLPPEPAPPPPPAEPPALPKVSAPAPDRDPAPRRAHRPARARRDQPVVPPRPEPPPPAPVSLPTAEAPPQVPRAVGPDTPPEPPLEAEPSPVPAAIPERAVPEGPSRAEIEAWGRTVRGAILAQRGYPRAARRMGLEGTAMVRVTLRADGTLATPPVIDRSSGHDVLDREALRMVRAAAPFPSTDLSLSGDTARFVVPIQFTLP